MSTSSSLSKTYSYNASIHKTPKFKETKSACSSYPDHAKGISPFPQIVMDEFGQTPDHFYLEKKSPASFYQAKRKLDLQSYDPSAAQETSQRRLRKKGNSIKIENKITPHKHRYDTSLGQLTKKFLKLLSEANDGVINLNTACSVLSVPKRRLYDITNVLEGAGLIQKTSRNNIQWMGRVSSPCASLMKYELEKEIDILEAKENKLDELIYHMKCEINTFKEAEENYHYVTGEDLTSIEEMSDQMLIGISLPSGAQVIESTDKTLNVSSKTTEIEACFLSGDLSFMNVTLPKEEYLESSGAYTIKIANSSMIISADEPNTSNVDTSFENTSSPLKIEESGSPNLDIPVESLWTGCQEGDSTIRNAFITEEDDIAPMGRHFLLQTEDQDLEEFMPFSYLDNPIDAYSFSLDVGEGLTDLYDCSFSCP